MNVSRFQEITAFIWESGEGGNEHNVSEIELYD